MVLLTSLEEKKVVTPIMWPVYIAHWARQGGRALFPWVPLRVRIYVIFIPTLSLSLNVHDTSFCLKYRNSNHNSHLLRTYYVPVLSMLFNPYNHPMREVLLWMEKLRAEKKNNLPKVIGSKCQAKVWIPSGSRIFICKPDTRSKSQYLAEGACRRLWPVHRHPNSCPHSGARSWMVLGFYEFEPGLAGTVLLKVKDAQKRS